MNECACIFACLAYMCACTCKQVCLRTVESMGCQVEPLKVIFRHCLIVTSLLISPSSFSLPRSRENKNSLCNLCYIAQCLLDSVFVKISSTFLYALTLLQLGGVLCTVQLKTMSCTFYICTHLFLNISSQYSSFSLKQVSCHGSVSLHA